MRRRTRIPAAPQRPVDLTAEAASDTNALGDSARGVFLTWNMQPKGVPRPRPDRVPDRAHAGEHRR